MAYFCAACGLDGGIELTPISEAAKVCIVDQILLVVGEMFQSFTINYLVTIIGHIIVTYSLLTVQDSTISSLPGGRREILHRAAYFLLIVDLVIEIVLLARAGRADPSSVSLDGYTECGAEYEKHIVDLKEFLVHSASSVLVIRAVFGALIAIVYVYKGKDHFLHLATLCRPGISALLAT